jgi:hypothetical protein
MNDIGDDEVPRVAGDVDIGGAVAEVVAGLEHTCARLASGSVRCFGNGLDGRLGYGVTQRIGDDETPAFAGDVDVGGVVVELSVGIHTCARLESGSVRCWGHGLHGRLGHGNLETIGDDETPASKSAVPIGASVRSISANTLHACALLTTGQLRCWGYGGYGQLGYGDRRTIGDDETPATRGDVSAF